MDGTMFDTERLRFQTLQQASQEIIGQEFSHEYLMQCLGLSKLLLSNWLNDYMA